MKLRAFHPQDARVLDLNNGYVYVYVANSTYTYVYYCIAPPRYMNNPNSNYDRYPGFKLC
jgi:hypothetical protein